MLNEGKGHLLWFWQTQLLGLCLCCLQNLLGLGKFCLLAGTTWRSYLKFHNFIVKFSLHPLSKGFPVQWYFYSSLYIKQISIWTQHVKGHLLAIAQPLSGSEFHCYPCPHVRNSPYYSLKIRPLCWSSLRCKTSEALWAFPVKRDFSMTQLSSGLFATKDRRQGWPSKDRLLITFVVPYSLGIVLNCPTGSIG